MSSSSNASATCTISVGSRITDGSVTLRGSSANADVGNTAATAEAAAATQATRGTKALLVSLW